MEAYLVAPPRPDPETSASRQEVPAKLACLPTTSHDTIYVPITSVYPSRRRLRTLSEEGKEIACTIGDQSFLPPAKRVTKKVFEMLEHHMPKSRWTLLELMSMMSQDITKLSLPSKLLTAVDLTERGEKYCTITGDRIRAYRIGKIFVEKKSITPITEDNLKSLEKEFEDCTKCELGVIRKQRKANLVFGRGDPNATGMIIAESPWEKEEQDKKPLHPKAPAGGVLYRVMTKVGLKQPEWYLTNAVICRPLLNPGASVSENKPLTRHRKACSSRLKRTLRTVSPKLVVLLGAYAYETWFGHSPDGGVGRNMGRVTVSSDSTGNPVNYIVYFLYHPSYINRMIGKGGKESVEAQVMYLEQWKQIASMYKELTEGT